MSAVMFSSGEVASDGDGVAAAQQLSSSMVTPRASRPG